MHLSILGIGTFLPTVTKVNADWPADVVASWRETFSPERARQLAATSPEGDGPSRVYEAMQSVAEDPFQGAVERRVMPDGMSAVDMATSAATAAMADAGVAATAIDFVLGSSFAPDLLNSPDPCGVHAMLGLRRDCFSVTVDAVCNSLQAQLSLAKGLVAQGQTGLLLQATAASRVTPMDAPMSVHFGDGASALVVGRGERRLLLGQRFETESELYRAMAITVPGGDWWDDGRPRSTALDKALARRMMPAAPDAARRLVDAVLAEAGVRHDQVQFFACHQATAWFRRVLQEYVGLSGARSFDTYAEAGTVSAANLPLVLDRARCLGLLSPGDLVVMFQGGTGATYGASLIRW